MRNEKIIVSFGYAGYVSIMITGSELQQIRKAAGLTQAQFAALIGRKRLAVVRWEADVNPVPGEVEIVARVLEAHPEMLADMERWRSVNTSPRDDHLHSGGLARA